MTLFLTGLLLAVGWTNHAHAQLMLPERNVDSNNQALSVVDADFECVPSTSFKKNAPRREATDVTTPVVHAKNWYEQFNYTWMDGNTQRTANLTDVVTNSTQMWYFLKYIYTNAAIPGPHYNKAYVRTMTYPGFGYGWNFGGPNQNYIDVKLGDSSAQIYSIQVLTQDESTVLTSWDYATNGASLPSGWLVTSSRSMTRYGTTSWCYYNYTSATTIRIPGELIQASGVDNSVVKVKVAARTISESSNSTLGIGNASWDLQTTGYYYNYNNIYGALNLPDEDGHTICLVKLNNNTTVPPRSTSTFEQLDSIFDAYVESIEILTDGLRVGEDGTATAGTVFSYSGNLNRFFFIGKGKLAKFGYLAPFYGMYEEYSPTTTEAGDEITDFYTQMTAGNAYGTIHDCASVMYMQHEFSMSGKNGTEEKALTSLVFYIPDERGHEPQDSAGTTYYLRNYDPLHQPQVGLYTIQLTASAQRVDDYSEENRFYNVTCDWTSSLDNIVGSTVPQTYELWVVVRDENGNPVRQQLLTTTSETTYTYTVPQYPDSYTIEYIVKGTPTNATNQDYFYTWSNLDNVLIPGYYDFVLLMNGHYESDFEVGDHIGAERNYYRNYMYLANSSEGTGMRPGQIKREWPNQTASYTLWRDDRGVATLKVLAIDDKVYYRIDYDEDSQDTTGPNNIIINTNNPSNTK